MAASAISSRPQTLRQARRAYQKAGATTRLSEGQIRQLERTAELQERADRIREREYRRKANLKKKNEKIEREREARARMGIPSPVNEDVGASQMRLGAFLTVGMEANTRCEGIQNQPIMPGCCQKLLEEDPPASAQRDTSTRSPLQPRSGNKAMKPPSSRSTPEVKPLRLSTAMLSSRCSIQSSNSIVYKDSKQLPVESLVRLSNHCNVEHLPKQTVRPSKSAQTEQPTAKAPARPPNQYPTKSHPNQTSQTAKTAQMPPPPLPISKPMSRITPKRISKSPDDVLPKPQPIVDEWAAFLVSNTQIEREIRTPDTLNCFIATSKSDNLSISTTPSRFLARSKFDPTSIPCLAPTSTTKATERKSDTEDLLAQTSAQDLQYTIEVKQEPRPDQIAENEQEELEFGDDITDIDLEGAVLQLEQAAALQPEGCLQVKSEENSMKPKQMDSFCDDDFDISLHFFWELLFFQE